MRFEIVSAAVGVLLVFMPDLAGAEARPDSASHHRRVIENTLVDTLATVHVTDSFDRSIHRIRSASQGAVTSVELKARPVYRPAEVLETVPGVVISQHSGEGKANQYYMRGFNLDHGTDMAIFVAGIPVNMPSHAHGQGYSDLNFLIPELVSGVEYKKGTYFADEGDFGTAGAAHLAYANRLEESVAQGSYDQDGYRRALVASSATLAGGDLLYAGEVSHNDGPWVSPDAYRKLNGVLRYGRTGPSAGWRVTAMGYDGRWNATDQIADRALDAGIITRFGSLDPTDGGRSKRFSLSGDWQHFTPSSFSQATVYAMDYRLNLFSNFTYFLEDSVNGDQFEQSDRRNVSGFRASQSWKGRWFDREVEALGGLHARRDDIGTVALYHTKQRERLATTREDAVAQTSASPFVQATVSWSPVVSTTAGLRSDTYWFRVRSDNPLNSGDARASILSPKFALTLGPWKQTAYFFNVGSGFHSNDARGSTITVDPKTLEPVGKVRPLVRATGTEIGVRSVAIPGIETSVAVWGLDLGSELVFVGDAGATEASRPSRRLGVEWTTVYGLGENLRGDASVAYSRARFRGSDPAGDRIPGAVEGVISAGITVPQYRNVFGSVRVRYFGPRPLIEDNSVRSHAATILSADFGYVLLNRLRASVEGFNLLDSKASDIDYYYTSRLRGEPAAGINDIHTHPEAPRTIRLRLTASWSGPRSDSSMPPVTGHPREESRN